MQKATLLAGLQTSPGDPWFLQALGSQLEEEQAWDELVQHFQKQLEIVPKGSTTEAYAHYMLGKAYVELSRMDQAIPHLERSIEFHADFPFTHHLLGRCYRSAGRLEDALSSHKRSLELAPEFPWSWLEQGEVQLLLNLPESAIQSLKQGLRYQRLKEPNNLDPFLHAIARAEKDLQRYKRMALAAELWPERQPINLDQPLNPLDELALSLAQFRKVLDQVETNLRKRSGSESSS